MAQTSPTEARITLAHCGRLIGISTATTYRWLAAGSLGKPRGKRPVYVDLAAVEAAIGPIDKARLERTRRTTARPGRPKKGVPRV